MKLHLLVLALAPLALHAQSTDTTSAVNSVEKGSVATEANRPPAPIPSRLKQQILKEFDKNKDGKINPVEEAAALESVRNMRAARHKEMLEKFDKTGDGTLDDAEKAEMRKDWQARLAGEREKIRKKFDTDGNGTLDEREKQAAHAAMQQQWDHRRKEFLKRFDSDGDGKLSDSEKAAAQEAKKTGHHPPQTDEPQTKN